MTLKRKDLIEQLGTDISKDEWFELIELLDNQIDFIFEIDGIDYRFIDENNIWDIYYDEQKELIEELYLPNINKQWWIEIDWDKTIDNVFSDGYGHHFSSYDGSEEQIKFNGSNYYIFKIG